MEDFEKNEAAVDVPMAVNLPEGLAGDIVRRLLACMAPLQLWSEEHHKGSPEGGEITWPYRELAQAFDCTFEDIKKAVDDDVMWTGFRVGRPSLKKQCQYFMFTDVEADDDPEGNVVFKLTGDSMRFMNWILDYLFGECWRDFVRDNAGEIMERITTTMGGTENASENSDNS